jgi:hypothetical protein
MADDPQPKKIPLIFFRTLTGSEPVREWLKDLPEEERQAIGKDLLRVQWRWPVGMPLCCAMGSGSGKFGRACRRSARRECCFAFIVSTSSRCTVHQEEPGDAK